MRVVIRESRRALPDDVRTKATQRIVNIFRNLASFRKARRIAGFLAFDGEADPRELMEMAWADDKEVFVPIIIAKRQPLQFCPWSPSVPMRVNDFGIEEPDVPRSEWIRPGQLDFVIHPLVAFDSYCHRVGVGGGYYDRSFQFLNRPPLTTDQPTFSEPVNKSPVLAGFAFELQRVSRIQRQPWDVILDWVITEKKIYRRSK